MEDHLKAAAEAADMSNDELMTTWAAVTDREILTNEQQAVMDISWHYCRPTVAALQP